MKTIECNSCHKKVEVEDDWLYKSCPICRAKDKARKEILKTKRELDHKSKQLIKELKLENIPQFLRSYSAYSVTYERLWHKEPTWEGYKKELEEAKTREIYRKADLESQRLRLEHNRKYREGRKLLRFDLFEPSNRKECTQFRMIKLEAIKKEEIQNPYFIDDHFDECENCRDWEYNRVNDTLDPLNDEEDDSEPVDKIEEWELEQWRKRGATLPDDSLDRFKSKQETESLAPSRISYQPLEQPEQHNPEPEQPDPTSSRDDLNNILIEHDQRKKRGSEETQNNEN